jgi:tetratricopeptide (TPR) repeat protein
MSKQSDHTHSRATTCSYDLIARQRHAAHRRGEGNALGNLGNVYTQLGQIQPAIEFYEQALAISREIGDRHGEVVDLNNLGTTHYDLGDKERAIEFYELGLTIAIILDDRRGQAAALFNISFALEESGELEQAIVHAEKALKLFEEIESPYARQVREQLSEWRKQP